MKQDRGKHYTTKDRDVDDDVVRDTAIVFCKEDQAQMPQDFSFLGDNF